MLRPGRWRGGGEGGQRRAGGTSIGGARQHNGEGGGGATESDMEGGNIAHIMARENPRHGQRKFVVHRFALIAIGL